MTTAEQELATWRERRATLTTRKDGAERQLEDLKNRRRPLVLDAQLGDEKKQRRLEKLTDEYRRTQVEVEDLADAVEQATAKVRDAEKAVADEKERARLAALKGLAEQRVAKAAEIEEAMKVLAAHLSAYSGLRNDMARHVDPMDRDRNQIFREQHLSETASTILGTWFDISHASAGRPDGAPLADKEHNLLVRFLNPDKVVHTRAAAA